MATKSILKNITIKDQKAANALVSALENASKKSAIEVTYSKSVTKADRQDIKKYFGE